MASPPGEPESSRRLWVEPRLLKKFAADQLCMPYERGPLRNYGRLASARARNWQSLFRCSKRSFRSCKVVDRAIG